MKLRERLRSSRRPVATVRGIAMALACLAFSASAARTAFAGAATPFASEPVVVGKPPILADVGITQKMGAKLPGELVFTDESGREVRLGDYLGHGRPVILTLVYYRCPMLCTLVLNELLRTVKAIGLDIGQGYDVITVSFDPSETPALAAEKKATYLASYSRPGAELGWHFLTGTSPSITKLTETVGFHYAWDAANKQFIHSSGLIILTPEGKVSRYFFGVDYAPRDIKFALMEASGGRTATKTEQAVLYCFKYDPHSGKYTLVVTNIIRVAGLLTVLALGSFIFLNIRRDRRAGGLIR